MVGLRRHAQHPDVDVSRADGAQEELLEPAAEDPHGLRVVLEPPHVGRELQPLEVDVENPENK